MWPFPRLRAPLENKSSRRGLETSDAVRRGTVRLSTTTAKAIVCFVSSNSDSRQGSDGEHGWNAIRKGASRCSSVDPMLAGPKENKIVTLIIITCLPATNTSGQCVRHEPQSVLSAWLR